MTEEEQNETGEQVAMETDYLAAINQLKQNSVPRQQYDQLMAENKKLLDAVVNGQTAEQQAPAPVAPDIQALRDKTFAEGQTNLEMVTNALALRKALMESGEPDPFLPCGDKTIPTAEDVAAAEKVATVFQECVDYAQGDSQLFTNELMRRTVDTGPIRTRR